MRKLFLLILVLSAGTVFAQTAQNPALGGQPIEITSSGGTTYEESTATAVAHLGSR